MCLLVLRARACCVLLSGECFLQCFESWVVSVCVCVPKLLCMWYFCKMFMCSFVHVVMIAMMPAIVPYLCPMCNVLAEYH